VCRGQLPDYGLGPAPAPYLDVLRTVAIVMVLGGTSPPSTPPGGTFAPQFFMLWQRAGWVGVDLFFCLSGFLIGGLLFGEHRRSGEIDVKRFYVRRPSIWPVVPACSWPCLFARYQRHNGTAGGVPHGAAQPAALGRIFISARSRLPRGAWPSRNTFTSPCRCCCCCSRGWRRFRLLVPVTAALFVLCLGGRLAVAPTAARQFDLYRKVFPPRTCGSTG